MANVTIDLAAEYRGRPAFTKAGKDVSSLEKSVKKLGKQFAGLFAAQKIAQFGKATAQAFQEDQKSAALLANTMKNLGLQFANPAVEEFIGKMSQAAGIADDQLRPAMQKLLQVTGSVSKSQELLTNALDISRGSGVDFETVVSDLSAAFVGNNKGLKKYAIGLTQAELKAASFDTVMQKFNENFSGSNAAYLATYAGEMQKLSVAAGEARETIGGGLIDAFKILAGDSSITNLSDKIQTIATNVADFFRGVAQGFRDLANMPVIKQLLQLAGVMLKIAGKAAGAFIDPFVKEGARKRSAALAPASSNSFLSEHMAASNAAKAAKAEADAKKRQKAIVDAQKKTTAELKKQALTKKQSALFDMDQIQLIAALKGKLSDEDRKRVELQLALLQGNEEAAAKLSREIANSIDQTGNLAKYLTTLPEANNPFKAWDTWLATFKLNLANLNNVTVPQPPNLPNTEYNQGTYVPSSGYVPPTTSPATNVPITTPFLDPNASSNEANRERGNYNGSGNAGNQTITVLLDGREIAASVQNQALNGNSTTINRSQGNFG